MDATATLGTWKKNLWQTIAVAALFGCTFVYPPLAIPFSLTLPLIACPAFAQGRLWFAIGLPLAPALAFFLAGWDIVIGAILLLFPCLCLLATSQWRRRRLSLNNEMLACVIAFLISGLWLLVRLSDLMGGALFPMLAEHTVTVVQSSAMSGNILYRLVSLGILAVPENYATTAGFQLGNWIWLNPELQRELLNMLRLRLYDSLSVWIPTLLVQGAIIVGLFTAIGTARARARITAGKAAMPSFQTLRIPKRGQGYMLLLCVGTALTSVSTDTLGLLLCTLMYAAFTGVYQLMGAAVLVFSLSRRHPRRVGLYGTLAALLYLVFPIALFLLGVADQFVNLRALSLQHQEEE